MFTVHKKPIQFALVPEQIIKQLNMLIMNIFLLITYIYIIRNKWNECNCCKKHLKIVSKSKEGVY